MLADQPHVTDATALQCLDPATSYIASIHACISSQLLNSTAFVSALLSTTNCIGGAFTTAASLQRLRFCQVVNGPIIMANITGAIDPTVFWDIEEVTGTQSHTDHRPICLLHLGPIVVTNTSGLASIDGFNNIAAVGTSSLYAASTGPVAVYIAGLWSLNST